jgi:hypothetical protein
MNFEEEYLERKSSWERYVLELRRLYTEKGATKCMEEGGWFDILSSAVVSTIFHLYNEKTSEVLSLESVMKDFIQEWNIFLKKYTAHFKKFVDNYDPVKGIYFVRVNCVGNLCVYSSTFSKVIPVSKFISWLKENDSHRA